MSIRVFGQPLIPSARRLINSLRDLGYDFAAAVADLIDNSITAGGSEVVIDVEFDGDNSWVRISDNGTGMTNQQLLEAMRYGSERDYVDDDLGRFGLGLKTASLSQCHKLTVATRFAKGDLQAYCWDLNHVEKTDKWELVIPDKKELDKILGGHLSRGTGTVVHWKFLDRMLGQKHPYGEASRKRLSKMCRELEEHVTMVFHRFLDGDVPDRKLKIILNGNELKAWDPFARDEPETIKMEPLTFSVERDDVSGKVKLQPYILPPKDKFSTPAAFNRAAGPNKWNLQQGFYIYRANRLIQSGGWCNLRAADEHTKLARIALDFSPHLDEIFNINVAKMKVQLPQEIREEMVDAVEKIVKEARKVYDKKVKPSPPHNPDPVGFARGQQANTRTGHETSVTGSGNEKKGGNQRLWTLDELQKQLMEHAFSDEIPIITKVFSRLRKKLQK